MKKTSHSPKAKKGHAPKPKRELDLPVEDPAMVETPVDEPDLVVDQFAVVGREDEASSSGHRIEPVQEDDEHNAEKLIEEGLHGYLRASPNHTHRAK
jgi:hypothetical protein